MDKFIGYDPARGFMEFEQASEALAEHQCYIHNYTYIGYTERFLQHLKVFTVVGIRP